MPAGKLFCFNLFGMKKAIIPVVCILLAGCGQNDTQQQMQATIDSLKTQLNNTYKPGLGEFMAGIQLHHAKLYFAGQKVNWKLADFEVHEIMEAVDDIKQYAADRPESTDVPMLLPALDSVNTSIKDKNIAAFNKSFIMLTNTCNTCHQTVHFEFNKIKIPSAPPVTNQEF